MRKVLRAEILVEPLGDPARLNGAGMILVNPPWTLEQELSALLPALIQVFGGAGKPGFRLAWLTAQSVSDGL
jgi:23S rRNA (adenine2030-N6)-methyltransferase